MLPAKLDGMDLTNGSLADQLSRRDGAGRVAHRQHAPHLQLASCRQRPDLRQFLEPRAQWLVDDHVPTRLQRRDGTCSTQTKSIPHGNGITVDFSEKPGGIVMRDIDSPPGLQGGSCECVFFTSADDADTLKMGRKIIKAGYVAVTETEEGETDVRQRVLRLGGSG